MLRCVLLRYFENVGSDLLETRVIDFLKLGVHCQHSLILVFRLQVNDIQIFQRMQNNSKPMIIQIPGQVRRMFLIIPQIIRHLIQSVLITTFAVHVLNAINCSIVLLWRIVEDLDAFEKGTNDITTQTLNVKNIAWANVTMKYFFPVKVVDAVHYVHEDLELLLCCPRPLSQFPILGNISQWRFRPFIEQRQCLLIRITAIDKMINKLMIM